MHWRFWGKAVLSLTICMTLGGGIFVSNGVAEARGKVYFGRNASTGRVEKYLSCYDTQYGSIWELTYEKVMFEGQNGVDYIIRATGEPYNNAFVVQHADKNGGSNHGSMILPNASYPFSYDGDDRISIRGTELFPGADKFLENCVPGTYDYHDAGVLMASPNACRLLLEKLPMDMTGIDASSPANYIFEDAGFCADIHEEYPESDSHAMGRKLMVLYSASHKKYETGMGYIGTFLVDTNLENVWRIDDGAFEHLYCIDGMG